jgi:integrase/recombinase XerD
VIPVALRLKKAFYHNRRSTVTTISEGIKGFVFHCRFEKNLSSSTLKAYEGDLKQFAVFLTDRGFAEDIAAVGKPLLRDFIQHLFTSLLAKSVKRKVATLKSLFRYLEGEEIVVISPFHNMDIRIREPRRLPRTVPLSTLRRLFKSLYHIKGDVVAESSERRRLLVRDIAVLELLFATAARISEICNLKMDDVDLRRGRVRIAGKGGRERLIHVSDPEVLSALNEYCSTKQKPQSGDCFFQNRNGKRLSDHAVRMLLRKHTKKAGIALHLTPHMIRHSVATCLLEDGVDIRYIQHLLGHTSISTTQLYTHVSDKQQRRVLKTHHPRRRFRTTA